VFRRRRVAPVASPPALAPGRMVRMRLDSRTSSRKRSPTEPGGDCPFPPQPAMTRR
jgi:hypothetical protein